MQVAPKMQQELQGFEPFRRRCLRVRQLGFELVNLVDTQWLAGPSEATTPVPSFGCSKQAAARSGLSSSHRRMPLACSVECTFVEPQSESRNSSAHVASEAKRELRERWSGHKLETTRWVMARALINIDVPDLQAAEVFYTSAFGRRLGAGRGCGQAGAAGSRNGHLFAA
jgi:hypothetical protein